ncbi:thiamine phosphate synthase [Reinekea marinisedimentorum]|uniref:Thiamine-phosphate synthase n=1 Tax=Reinekea marinisedimentorum TaxID=230495 RepID=A0A4R3IES7_9GAMM|nr:thiamine phosphate synthase [Reinekea marinisedimentorum]TCS43301.1 hydroxymethylpyrimidine kinase/phosphomethylpyrimidine kinase/thiamine-phosphate diphosphorylase [Reinekea marinisedimentorum]
MNNETVIWTIGGLDPSNGAGISRDLAVFQNLQQRGYSLCTAVTAQNHMGVSCVQPVKADVLNQQFQALLELSSPSVIKISMIADDAQATVIAHWLEKLRQQNPQLFVVYDPVLSASAGGQLSTLSGDAIAALCANCDLLCPNYHEAQALTESQKGGVELIHELNQKLDARAVVLKGGHSGCEAVEDLLWQHNRAGTFSVKASRLAVSKTHGTGCTFAAALSVFVAQNFELEDALYLAKCYVFEALQQAENNVRSAGNGPWHTLGLPGWPKHRQLDFAFSEQAGLPAELAAPFPSIDREKFRFYPVLDSIDWVRWALGQGVKTVQLRLKDASDEQQLRQHIRTAVKLGRRYDAQVFINDYWALAIEEGAYGVHLGQEDLASADLNAIAAAGLRLGLSTHSIVEIERACRVQPSYIALGHIFPTQTKDMPSQPQGLTKLGFYQQWLADRFPTVAIGGISLQRAKPVLAQGVSSIAVVTALTKASKPGEALQQFNGVVNEHFSQ